MQFDASEALLRLTTPQPLRLTGARGTVLRAMSGTLWVTTDNDPRDQVLQAGESLVVDSTEQVMVSALGGRATVGVCAPVAAQPRWRQALGRLASAGHGARVVQQPCHAAG